MPAPKYIVATGNPFGSTDGLKFIGPFDSFEDADEYARSTDLENSWIIELISPDENG